MSNDNPLIDYGFLEAKIEWIELNYLSLLHLIKTSGEYSRDWRPEFGKFGDYLGCAGCEEIFSSFKKAIESLDEDNDTDRSTLAGDGDLTEFINDLKRLSSPGYEAPSEDEILKDLGLLWAYWKTCLHSKTYFANIFSGVPEAGLDMALVKLSKNIGRYEIVVMIYGRDVFRRLQADEAKKEKENKRKEFVKAIYEHGETIKAGTKFNKVCGIIKNQFEKGRGVKDRPWGTIPKDPKEMKTPSLDSIGRWLKEAGIFDRDFIQEEGFWIKRT